MRRVIIVPDLAKRPYYVFNIEDNIIFTKVFDNPVDGFIPRSIMSENGRPFNEDDDFIFLYNTLVSNNIDFYSAPANDYIRSDNHPAIGGMFQNRVENARTRTNPFDW